MEKLRLLLSNVFSWGFKKTSSLFVQNKKRVGARHLKIDELEFKSLKVKGFEYKRK